MSVPLTKQETAAAARESSRRASGLIRKPEKSIISSHSSVNMPPFHSQDPKRPGASESETLGQLHNYVKQ